MRDHTMAADLDGQALRPLGNLHLRSAFHAGYLHDLTPGSFPYVASTSPYLPARWTSKITAAVKGRG
jgi:hypothetical protein